MVKMIAKTVIHLTDKPGKPGDASKGVAPVRPTTKEIAREEIFEATDEQRKELLSLNAAVDAPKDVDKDSARTAKGREKVAQAAKSSASKSDDDDGKDMV